MMTQEERKLWDRIESFQFENPNAALKFVNRLARENGWTVPYAIRVVEEYKKFIFLCCISPNGATPSDAVDQAWHLHLTYTKSYWIDFCKNTIGRDIHHNPTEGGKKEDKKYRALYDSSLSLYEQKFGEPQPADIWKSNDERFSDINFQRINVAKHWIFKKPKFFLRKTKAAVALFALLAASLSFIQATASQWFWWIFFIVIGIIILYAIFKPRRGNRNGGSSSGDSGCTSWIFFGGCGSSGCSSGDSGCGSSGCSSGCGGGCGGGGCSS